MSKKKVDITALIKAKMLEHKLTPALMSQRTNMSAAVFKDLEMGHTKLTYRFCKALSLCFNEDLNNWLQYLEV